MQGIRTTESKEQRVFDLIQTMGDLDYVKDGKIYRNVPVKSVMVESSADLAILEGYEPGAFAFTAGFGSIWQKKADGTWASV
jgi:hypothetical protein